eukprot:COSAG04_NODE_17546_length_466_cov_0.972752_2_plen_90_part_01
MLVEVDKEYDSLPDEQQVALHRNAFLNLRAQLRVREPEELDVIGWLARSIPRAVHSSRLHEEALPRLEGLLFQLLSGDHDNTTKTGTEGN